MEVAHVGVLYLIPVRDGPSLTALYVAAMRGLGGLLPADVRLADDPYGIAFSSPRLARWLSGRSTRLATLPGVAAPILYMQVRTRVIDDQLRAFVAGGGRQLVVLGAGYDCRALRMPELADGRVIEVDHPATQARKRARLAEVGATSPAYYLEWDFETRALGELPDALADAGLDRDAPTFTIWEGVTMYLTDAAIDTSLRAIRAYSAAGSQLAMTYFAKSRLHRKTFAHAMVARFGEPWRFAWEPSELSGYLRERGFELVTTSSIADAARALLPRGLAAHIAYADRHEALASASV